MLTKNQNKIFIISIILWAVITVFRLVNRIPEFDEAHAWTIAQQLNLFQVFKIMYAEGHTFIWYLLLMPFAKTNFLYPYSLQILNWVFCLLSLIVLWKKSPFNVWIKVLLTFSYPFLFVYSVQARCYAIGILLLFIIASLYKDRMSKPVLFSTLLVITVNTSVMAAIPSMAVILLFIYYDIFKKNLNNKTFVYLFFYLIAGAGIFLLQVLNFKSSLTTNRIGFDFSLIKNIFIFNNIGINSLILLSVTISLIYFFFRYKKALFILFFSVAVFLFGMQFFYTGYAHHHFFLLIYLVFVFWIVLDNYKDILSFKYFANILLALLLINFLFTSRYTQSEFQYFYRFIINNDEFDNSTIIMPEIGGILRSLLPYESKKYVLKDYCSDDKLDYKLVKYVNTKYCEGDKTTPYKVLISSDRLNDLMDNSYAYLFLINDSSLPFYDFQLNNITFNFKSCIKHTKYCYWLIKK